MLVDQGHQYMSKEGGAPERPVRRSHQGAKGSGVQGTSDLSVDRQLVRSSNIEALHLIGKAVLVDPAME